MFKFYLFNVVNIRVFL